MVKLELTTEEVEDLLSMLETYLPDLERELAGTDLAHREYRQTLKKRKAVMEEMIRRLKA